MISHHNTFFSCISIFYNANSSVKSNNRFLTRAFRNWLTTSLSYKIFTPPWLRRRITYGSSSIFLESNDLPPSGHQRSVLGVKRLTFTMAGFYKYELAFLKRTFDYCFDQLPLHSTTPYNTKLVSEKRDFLSKTIPLLQSHPHSTLQNIFGVLQTK